jgi:hypothetical protein
MGKEEALQNSLSDPALLHASLAHVAKTLSSLDNTEMSPNIIYHIGKAITMVNKRIASSRQNPVAIETIGAVTTITAFEVRNSGAIIILKVLVHSHFMFSLGPVPSRALEFISMALRLWSRVLADCRL